MKQASLIDITETFDGFGLPDAVRAVGRLHWVNSDGENTMIAVEYIMVFMR